MIDDYVLCFKLVTAILIVSRHLYHLLAWRFYNDRNDYRTSFHSKIRLQEYYDANLILTHSVKLSIVSYVIIRSFMIVFINWIDDPLPQWVRSDASFAILRSFWWTDPSLNVLWSDVWIVCVTFIHQQRSISSWS